MSTVATHKFGAHNNDKGNLKAPAYSRERANRKQSNGSMIRQKVCSAYHTNRKAVL